jgi:hypothetical protein
MTEVAVECNLGPLFGDVRDQGERPTCLAFAASDVHAALRAGWEPLSCEYAFYQAQRRSNRPPKVGARLPDMLDALRDNGQPQEEGWPYLAATPPDGAEWNPPQEVGELYRRLGAIKPESVDAILRSLDRGKPIMVLMTLSHSFYSPPESGVIQPQQGEQPVLAIRHAIVAIGHGVVGGERAILIRNSWGKDWGVGGYAWLTETFLTPRLMRLAALTEEINGPDARQAA